MASRRGKKPVKSGRAVRIKVRFGGVHRVAGGVRRIPGVARGILGGARGVAGFVAGSRLIPYALLGLMTLAYIVVFTATVLYQYSIFWYGNFDLGIPDQGIWLLSQFKTPYLTTRGIHLFGDHPSFIHLFVAPIYWFWDDVRALLILHTVALAAGSIAVYLIALERFKSRWVPLVFSFCYLIYPALHYSNLDQGYHYESFMVPFTLFGYWFLMKGKYWAYYVMFIMSLICKEEVAFSYILFGIYIFFVFDRRAGAVTTFGSIFWILLFSKFLLPYFNSEGAFYSGRTLGSFGKTPTEIAASLANPIFMFNKIVTMKNFKYFMEVLGPTGFLVFQDLPSLACAASLYINLITDWPYAHEIRYHYVTPIIPFVFISLINGIGKRRGRKGVVAGLLLILVVSMVVGNEYVSPGEAKFFSERERIWNTIKKMGEPEGDSAEILKLIDRIPKGAKVSASYNLVSHLTHRERIYMFPNPFRVNLYGIDEKGVHPDKEVDYVILDMRLVRNEMDSVLKVNESGRYELIGRYEYVDLYRNIDYGRG